MLAHELIHVEQIRRLGWGRFYVSYLFEFFGHLRRLKNWRRAYLEISFEREAYLRQSHYEVSDDLSV